MSGGRRSGVPVDARRQICAIVRAEAASGGRTARAIADELGVHPTTISRWLREDGAPQRRRGRAFRAVRVVAERAAPTAPPSALRAAHPASGLVIEGLDVATLAALLRSLGS
jgi:IS30 family transposase